MSDEHDLTAVEMRVLSVLLRHQGRVNAISKEQLATDVDTSERLVRRAIVNLIEHHKQPIGSTSMPPGGYFMIQTQEEQAEAEAELFARLKCLARRLAHLKRNTPIEIADQLRMELAETT